ncbi:MAG: hypothetical protein JSW37_11830 [Anaerolineales bacterium]|nr:MAG: hypothetical protein JSW37_11830 [Anaerolineales bacterium]
MSLSSLFPRIDRDYTGPRSAFIFFVVISIVSTIRSLVHMLSADGGASSIAGISIDVAGGQNIVAVFGQWGASQLILALMYWLVIIRYRFLVPAMLGLAFVEQLLRLGVGQIKPIVEVIRAPPGAIGSLILLPLTAIALWISLQNAE